MLDDGVRIGVDDHATAATVDDQDRAIGDFANQAATDPDHLAKVDPHHGGPIIVYCGGGECETSIEVAWFLVEAGYTKVTYFPDGYQGWADEGYPVGSGREGDAR